MQLTIEYRSPLELKPHPLNDRVYGQVPTREFVESIREHGVIEPIHVTLSGTVVSGHRRRHAAAVCKLRTVPVIVRRDLEDPLDIEKALLLANEHREKTVEQRVREAEEMTRILKALQDRKLRKWANLPTSTTGIPDTPDASPKRVRDEAAESVGMSRRTLDAAAKVVAEIDRATEDGDVERAEELRETLNTKSVKAAVEKADPNRAECTEIQKRLMLLGQSYRVFGGHVAWITENAGTDHKAATDMLDSGLAKIHRGMKLLEKKQ